MRLVLREYLSMLKESGELDALLPDLLLSMDLVPTSKAQVGARQFGVDVAGVGPDPNADGRRTLFLFTVKRGDFDRASWDGDVQDVRPSLNEIRDVYISSRVSSAHRNLPAKIVLCCGGEMKQNVRPNWKGYVDENEEEGVREYAFWGGDRLALLIERHMLSEHLFPESARKQMRKTIALADDNEQPPHHFYDLARETLFERDLPSGSSKSDVRKRRRAFRLLNLSLNIVFHWSDEAGNLRPALLCAERTLLTAWDWIRVNDLFDCDATLEEFLRLFGTYFAVAKAFARKLRPHCFVEDGLSGRGLDETEYVIRTFEVIGILGLLCLSHITLAQLAEPFKEDEAGEMDSSDGDSGGITEPGSTSTPEDEEASKARADKDPTSLNQALEHEAEAIGAALALLIGNNASALTPCYDDHVIDLSIGLLALTATGHRADASAWTEHLARRIPFAYNVLGRHFPIATDSFEDLVALQIEDELPKEELMELSTLLPTLAQWHAVLDLEDSYAALARDMREIFAETNFQLWYPGEDTDDHIYRTNAGYQSGMTVPSLPMPETLKETEEQISRLSTERSEHEHLSCFEQGWPILSLIASRHFRTPVIPVWWQKRVDRA